MRNRWEFFNWTQRIFQLGGATPARILSQRMLNRDQGRALELIGHGVDYLLDSYVHEGADDELIDAGIFSSDAIQILVSMRRHILLSTNAPESERQGVCTISSHPAVEPCVGNPMEQV